MNKYDLFFTKRKLSLQTKTNKDDSISNQPNLLKSNIHFEKVHNNLNFPRKSPIKINKTKLPSDFFQNQYSIEKKKSVNQKVFNIQIITLPYKKISSQSQIDKPSIMSQRDYKGDNSKQTYQLMDKTSYFGFSEKLIAQNTSNINKIRRNYYTSNQQRKKNEKSIQQKNKIQGFQLGSKKKNITNKKKEDDQDKIIPLPHSFFKNKGINKLFYDDIYKQFQKNSTKKTGNQLLQQSKKKEPNQNKIQNITFFNRRLLPTIDKQFQ